MLPMLLASSIMLELPRLLVMVMELFWAVEPAPGHWDATAIVIGCHYSILSSVADTGASHCYMGP